MRCIGGLAGVFTLAAGLMAWINCGVAQTANDQISIVIPSVLKGNANLRDADAALISYILGLSIKRYFVRVPGMHRSAIITVPAPLTDHKPSVIKKLARINGAQIALLMRAFRQAKGVLIDIVMVIPERYRDFRTNPVEVLHLDFEGSQLSLDIPSKYMSFPTSVFLKNEGIEQYRNLCPIARCDTDRKPKIIGPCRLLGVDVPYSQPSRYYEISGTTAILRLDDVCYLQKWPADGPVSQPIIDFVAGVERFFAADRAVAKERMTAVVSSTLSEQSSVVLQAYLYLVRLSIQTNSVDAAKHYMELALSINRKDPNVLETNHFLTFWLLTRAVRSHSRDAKVLVSVIDNDLKEEPAFIRRPYQELLDRLKAKVRRGD